MMRHRCSACFIVPPKVLRHFAEKAAGAEREALLDQAELSAHIRGERSMGAIAALAATPAGEKRRTVFDAKHLRSLPGALVRGEGAKPTADASANQAYDAAGTTYDFFDRVLGRNSIDGRGMRIDSSVHFARRFNNAFWNGRQMVYGDGDQKLFVGFTQALDVVAHELMHGVTQWVVPGGGGLAYEGQSGALNESFSDVFGSVVKQWHSKQTAARADWLIGAGVMAPAAGRALRSMADPGNPALTWPGDDQPKHMKQYVPDGDVHTNSGIPNHAFYLAATLLGGRCWEKAGPIWYRALSRLTADATFAEAATATAEAAASLFGAPERTAVVKAWRDVGVRS
jgi:Zn-dependent metalloprotease